MINKHIHMGLRATAATEQQRHRVHIYVYILKENFVSALLADDADKKKTFFFFYLFFLKKNVYEAFFIINPHTRVATYKQTLYMRTRARTCVVIFFQFIFYFD